ncbi:MAG: calcium-binding protein [Planctomycetes bacterium]|nr:calcium-binding protein [Planctomycetota bacterium]
MTLELFRPEARMYRRTSLVNVPSGTALAELRIPADRRGWVVVAHDASSDPVSTIAEFNNNGLATLCVRLDGAANARFLAETVAWLKRSVAEAQGLPVGLLGFGAAASAALEAAAVLGTSLGALVAVNAAPDLAKARLNGVRTFTLLITDEEHLGVNRRAAQRVRGVARLEIADGLLEEAARVYGAAWLSGHLGAAAPARGMLSRLVGSWRMPKLWLGASSRAAAAFLLAAGAYFASSPNAHAATTSTFSGGVLAVVGDGTDTNLFITESGGNVLVNGANPTNPGGPIAASQVTSILITGSNADENISVASVSSAAFTQLDQIVVDAGAGADTITGSNQFAESLIGGTGADSVVAQGGNDTLVGGSAELDTLSGGDGDDLVIIEGGTEASPSADGGLNNDTLRCEGTAGNDSLTVVSVGANFERLEVDGGLGNDTVFGGALFVFPAQMVLDGNEGQDSIVGPNLQTGVGIPAITLLGGGGNDTLSAFPAALIPGPVTLIGGLGDDSLVGGALNDLLQDGGDGSTTAFGGGGGGDSLTVNADSVGDLMVLDIRGINRATVSGGFGNDIIEIANCDVNAGLLQLQVNGGDGFDSIEMGNITGASLAVTLFGGPGNDTISGSNFIGDTIFGDAGDDSLMGNNGNDSIIGDDSLFGSVDVGNDTLSGGTGNDTLFGELSSLTGGDDLLFGDDGNDSLDGSRNNDTVFGGAGDDIFDDLDGGNDSLVGGTGNDLFFMKPGSEDSVADSGGLDTLSFAAATAAVRMDLSKQGVRQSLDSSGNGLTLFGVFEGWTGSNFNDELFLTPIVSPRRVDGGPNDSVGTGDILHYDPKGFGVTDNDTAGTLTPDSGGFGVVTYLNWESIDLTDSFDPGDIDGDSLPNGSDDDDDNDGIVDDKDPDRDGDGWDNDVEELFGTDPNDPLDFPDDSITGTNSGADTDGDGIPDEIEDVTGNLDLGVAPGPMSVSKFKGKLVFPAALKDTLSFKARLAMPLGFTLNGAHIVVDIGGVIKEFDLDARGSSSRLVKDDKAKMKILPTKKQVQDGALLADLTVTLKKQDFSADLADEGLDNTASDLLAEEVVALVVIVESSPFKAVKKVIYTNKTGTSGSFKNTKVVPPTP